MANSAPIPIIVPATVGLPPGPASDVSSLGSQNRTFIFNGPCLVKLYGTFDGVNFAPVLQPSNTSSIPVTFGPSARYLNLLNDRSLGYAIERLDSAAGAATLHVSGEDVGSQLSALSLAFTARNVGPAANVANLAAFPVAGNDGITNVAGDVVLLYAQTDPTENGPYVVGGVAAGVAPLTPPSWWASGELVAAGRHVDVAQGNLFNGTDWKAFATSAFIVDSADPVLRPLVVSQQVVLEAGTVTIANVPIKSAFVGVSISRAIANTTALTVQYNPSTITPGVIGVASMTIQAQIAAGTINVADLSSLNVTIEQG